MVVFVAGALFSTLTSLTHGFVLPPKTRMVGLANEDSSKQRLSMAAPDFDLDPKETAFVFIEYQNEFTTVRKKKNPNKHKMRAKERQQREMKRKVTNTDARRVH